MRALRRIHTWLALVLLLAVALLAACSPTAPEGAPVEAGGSEPQATVEQPAADIPQTAVQPTLAAPTGADAGPPAPTQLAAITEPVPPTEAASENPPAAAEAACPARGAELHASDPSEVQLASGKVQLVEFFAFW